MLRLFSTLDKDLGPTIPLRNVLTGAGFRTLYMIAHYHALPINRVLRKDQMVEQLYRHLLHLPLPIFINYTLDDTARSLLREVAAAGGCLLDQAEIDSARLPFNLRSDEGWPALQAMPPVQKLRALGLLHGHYDGRGRPVTLTVPTEVAAALVTPDRIRHTALPEPPPVAQLLEDAVHMLSIFANRQAQHKVAERLSATDLRPFVRRSPQYGLTSAERTERLQAVHDILHHCGWLRVGATGCTPTSEAISALHMPPEGLVLYLLQAWANAAEGSPILNRAWHQSMLREIFRRLSLLHGRSVPLDLFLQSWPHQSGLAETSSEALAEQLIRGPFYLLGFVACGPQRTTHLAERGESSDWELALRPTTDGRAWVEGTYKLPPVRVAPEYRGCSIIVPPLCHELLRFELEPWARYSRQLTTQHNYALSQSSVRSAMRAGLTAKALLATLRRHVGEPPPAILEIIREASTPTVLQLSYGLILQTESGAALDQILAKPEYLRHLGPRLGPEAVLIRPGHEARIRRVLERQGFLADAAQAPSRSEEAEDRYYMALALRLAQQVSPDHAAAFARLAQRIVDTLPKQQIARMEEDIMAVEPPAPEEYPMVGDPPAPDLPCVQDLERSVRRAIESASSVRILYFTQSRGVVTSRRVQPLRLVGSYLTAYCYGARAQRLFRIDRILSIENAAVGSSDEI